MYIIYIAYDPQFDPTQNIEAKSVQAYTDLAYDELIDLVNDHFGVDLEDEDAQALLRDRIFHPTQFETLQIIGR